MQSQQLDKEKLTRSLTFRDLFFLSFGGMSPLLSILTYGAFAFTLAGYDAPIVMLIGTFLVLLNGLGVTRLSRRFSSSGGYYTYAFQALSARIGFDTGWMYIFYSILYGLAYLMGAVFILNLVFGLSVYLVFAIVVIPSVTFLIVGIRLSSKYAIYAVILEIGLMIAIIVVSFVITRGAAYLPNPVRFHITSSDFFLGILFAMGIPTGYGSIAPVSGEVKDPKKDVGRSVVTVILTGGILASLIIYAIANLVLQTGIVIPFSDKLPIIVLLRNDFSKYGIYLYYAVAVATVNDAILALLSFGSAASRTIFRMGFDRSFPAIFARRDKKGNPIVAVLVTSAILLLLPILFLNVSSPESAFIALGTISALGGLFIHISADFSLIRIGLRRGKRLALKAKNTILFKLKDYDEFILAIVGAFISTIVIIYSAYSTVPVYVTIFLTWIVVGFILSEVKGIVTKTPYELDITREGKIVAQNLENLSVNDKSVNVVTAVYRLDDSLKAVVDDLMSKHTPSGIVVSNDSAPVGVINLVDLLLLPQSSIDNMKVRQVRLDRVVAIRQDRDVTEALRMFKENNVDVLAIVDEKGKCIGSLSDREVLLGIGTLDKELPA